MLLSEYKKSIISIDEIKEDGLKKGLTSKCKKQIDKVYSKIDVQKDELELELYKRKSSLLNDVMVTSNLKYDMVMSSVGAFLGAVIGFSLQESVHLFIEIYKNIKEGTFFNLSPSEILYSDSIFGESVILLFVIIIGLYVLHKKEDMKRNDEMNVFQVDMGNYEIKKIDELLKKL